ncbi:MAG: hypothetical protein IJW12_04380 [Opitutales bacterium]|nr:hypothetical protein [Opitutales bacterium]
MMMLLLICSVKDEGCRTEADQRENFYFDLTQFLTLILAKKKVALQAFFRGNEKKKREDRRLACPRDFSGFAI